MSVRHPNETGIVVIGLGRFGSRLAESLSRLGHEVLAVDRDPVRVQHWSGELDRVVQADSTDEEVLRQLGLADFRRVVVAIGASLEAGVLTVLALAELGIEQIWARATSEKHAKILHSVGAHHVVFPEAETGERVAHLIVSRMLDFIEFGDDFAIAKIKVPAPLVGRSLRDIAPQDRYGVMVVGAKRSGQPFRYAGPDTVLTPDSVLIVEGGITQVQRFSALG
ncbi:MULTISPECIES: TrkA family potassium uptake protein [unclassified Micromonospora]|uniref:potassium channel family protein n=1 Tax=unclassified Micromonospora TaxID=2617518 RepID=UPI001C224A76|nr:MULTISPECIES: TrkA family potassium uptake protein [unclassified Micromonospora]MBU8857216.1 TrkA family potassium uptake protein [Micromonospora sp. WMMB482]MDM4782838.1 TrkA family potassium uptake protein [Micromonospora sp. b486]